jgi:hypothetical protein
MKLILASAFILIVSISIIYAAPEKQEPPKEAIEVCVGLDVESICFMETPMGTLEGKCMNTPDKKYFVCMPEGGPDNNRPEKK